MSGWWARQRERARRTGPWFAVGGMAVLLWFIGASVLFAPWQAVLVMVLLWLVLAVVTARATRRQPGLSPLLPLLGTAAWLAGSIAGGAYLGWGG